MTGYLRKGVETEVEVMEMIVRRQASGEEV
jgi:hypothetical protein